MITLRNFILAATAALTLTGCYRIVAPAVGPEGVPGEHPHRVREVVHLRLRRE